MGNDTFTPLKNRIVEFFSRHPREAFTANELIQRLGVSRNQHSELRHNLRELVKVQLLRRERRKRYARAVPSRQHQPVGTLRIGKQGDGIVELHQPQHEEIGISPQFMGTALDGDIVSVAIFAHQTLAAQRIQRSSKPHDSLPEGEIVKVIQRSGKPIVGQFEKRKTDGFFVVPDNRRTSKNVYIPKEKTLGAHPGDKVVSVVEEWESPNLNPEGKIIEILGKRGEVRAEMMSVMRMFNLPTSFPNTVVEESAKIASSIPKEEYKKRLDLRKELCFTIDPEDAKDFDDAVSLEVLSSGDWKIGVHIADVSHYVKEGTELDKEALKRGTSIYLADEVIPMLPEKLSNDVCSLRPHEDRLTVSSIMIVDDKGIVKDYTIERSIIHSKRRFTYEEVQTILDKGRGDYAQTLIQMHSLAQILLKKRMKEGSIDFETTETKFRFDAKGQPTEIIKKIRMDAHRLIEDFMLLANKTVAGHIGQERREKKLTDGNLHPFIYRIHDVPKTEKIEVLATFVAQFGYSLNTSGGVTSRTLQKLLGAVKGTEEEAVINEVAIRSMAKAVYSEKNIGHFGLGFRFYTHFTSPIRRYPDLVVHRVLEEYKQKIPVKRRQQLLHLLPEICEHSSQMEQRAMEAERESVKVMQVEYMKRHLGDEFRAVISGVTHFGLFIEIMDLLVEGLIRMRDLEDDYYVYDEKNYAIIGKRTRKRYRLGDKVRVQVVRVDPEEREIDFVMVK